MGAVDRSEQGGGTLLEGVGVGGERGLKLLVLGLGGLFMVTQGLRPGVADGCHGLRELAGNARQLGFDGAEQLVVQAARFSGDAGHGGGDDGLNGLGGDRRAVAQAGLERLVDGLGQIGVEALGFFVEALLTGRQ